MQRIKAFTYKADGNTVTQMYFNVTELTTIPHTFISKVSGNDSEDFIYYDIIMQLSETVCVNIGRYSLNNVNNYTLLFKDMVSKMRADYVSWAMESKWISKLYIAVANELGLDVTPLTRRRAEIIKAREDEKAAIIAARQAEREQLIKEYKLQVKHNLEALLRNESITRKDLLGIIDVYKIPVHARTLGNLNKHPCYLLSKDSVTVTKQESKGTFGGTILKLVRSL